MPFIKIDGPGDRPDPLDDNDIDVELIHLLKRVTEFYGLKLTKTVLRNVFTSRDLYQLARSQEAIEMKFGREEYDAKR